jgi:hypothetical protein
LALWRRGDTGAERLAVHETVQAAARYDSSTVLCCRSQCIRTNCQYSNMKLLCTDTQHPTPNVTTQTALWSRHLSVQSHTVSIQIVTSKLLSQSSHDQNCVYRQYIPQYAAFTNSSRSNMTVRLYCTYNVTLRCVRATAVVGEKQ